MPGIRSGADPAAWSLTAFADLDAMPRDCEPLFCGADFLSSRAWYRAVIGAAVPADAAVRLLVCRHAGQPVALFPMQIEPGGTLCSLTTPYTLLYRPLFAADAGPASIGQAGRMLGRFCRRFATTRIDALDPAWPGLASLVSGLRWAGLAALRFDHFGNWHTGVQGMDWKTYLAARPGSLRETLRRRLRRGRQEGGVEFDLAMTPEEVASSMREYEDVYRRSWKSAEPFAKFDAAFAQAACACGLLRLGILRHDGRAVAAQYWLVEDGRATVMKLAHDEAFAALSPGTVLTAMMIRLLLEREAVSELDFGRGDDPYKQLWTDQRRQRIGILLANPRRLKGVAALAKHVLGQARRAWRRRD